MSARVLECVVIVVPSFTLSQNSDQGVVHRDVVGLEHLTAPHVTKGVNSPSDVPGKHCPKSKAPDDCWETSNRKVDKWLSQGNLHVVSLQPLIILLIFKIFNILGIEQMSICSGVKHPAHVWPPEAVVWTMRIGKIVAMEVMSSVGRAPLDWISLNSEDSHKS